MTITAADLQSAFATANVPMQTSLDKMTLLLGEMAKGGGGSPSGAAGGAGNDATIQRIINSGGGLADEFDDINQILNETEDGLSAFGKATITQTKTIVKSSGSLVMGLDDTTVKFTTFAPIIDAAASTLSKLALAGGELGGIFAVGIPKMLGKVASTAILAASAYAGFALGQLQKTVDSMRDLQKVGIQFSGGLTEMRKQATESGLTLAQFQLMTKKTSADLLAFGGSLAGGVREMNKRFTVVGTAEKELAAAREEELINLGYSFAEAKETQVEYMGLQARSGALNRMSDAEVRRGSHGYAKNLKMLSSFTGEEVDALQKKQAEERSHAAARATLLQLEQAGVKGASENYGNLVTVATKMGPDAMLAMREMFANNGNLVTKESVIWAKNNATSTDILRESLVKLKKGIDPEVFNKDLFTTLKTNAGKMQTELNTMIHLAQKTTIGGNELLDSVTKNFTSMSDFVKQISGLKVGEMFEDQKGAAKGKDETSQLVAEATRELQKTANTMQEMAALTLPHAASILKVATSAMDILMQGAKGLKAFVDGIDEIPEPIDRAKIDNRTKKKVEDIQSRTDLTQKSKDRMSEIEEKRGKRRNLAALGKNATMDSGGWFENKKEQTERVKTEGDRITTLVKSLVEKISADGKIKDEEKDQILKLNQAMTDNLLQAKKDTIDLKTQGALDLHTLMAEQLEVLKLLQTDAQAGNAINTKTMKKIGELNDTTSLKD